MNWLRNVLDRFTESDEDRLADETREWAASLDGTVRLDRCPKREPVKVAGVVRRLSVHPAEGKVEAVISDGTGEITALFSARGASQGIGLGSRLVLEGVIGEARGRRQMINPEWNLALPASPR